MKLNKIALFQWISMFVLMSSLLASVEGCATRAVYERGSPSVRAHGDAQLRGNVMPLRIPLLYSAEGRLLVIMEPGSMAAGGNKTYQVEDAVIRVFSTNGCPAWIIEVPKCMLREMGTGSVDQGR